MKATEGKRLAAILGAYIAVFSSCVLVPKIRPYILWIGLVWAVIFSAVLLFREKRKRILLQKSVLILLMVISVVSASVFGMKFLSAYEFAASRYPDGEAYAAEGYITEISYEENYGSCYRVRLQELNGKETELCIMLSLPYGGGFCIGDIVAFEGVFSLPEEDSAIYRKAEGIFLSAEAETAEQTGTREIKETDRFQKIRLSMQRNFERFLDKSAAGFAAAICTASTRGSLPSLVATRKRRSAVAMLPAKAERSASLHTPSSTIQRRGPTEVSFSSSPATASASVISAT